MKQTIMASSSDAAEEDCLVHVAFNSKATHFVAATASGIRVFRSTPLKHVFTKTGFAASPDADAGGGEVISADVALSGSLVAVVFRDTADNGSSDDDKIRFWSELTGKMLDKDMNPSSHGAVRAVRQAGNLVLVAGDGRVTLHETSKRRTRRADEFETGPNPTGVCALAQRVDRAGQPFVLACPGKGGGRGGRVQVRGSRGLRVDVDAHSSGVACVALSRDGRLLATAGSRGTLLRVFSTADGKKLQELRRGSDRANIHCLAFSPDSKWLAASSDKGTIHVFSINVDLTSSSPEYSDDGDAPNTTTRVNQGWSLSYFSGFVPVPRYFRQDYSLAKLHLREGVKYMVAFSHEPHTVLIIGMDGSFYRCQFDPVNGGEMKLLEFRNFMNIE